MARGAPIQVARVIAIHEGLGSAERLDRVATNSALVVVFFVIVDPLLNIEADGLQIQVVWDFDAVRRMSYSGRGIYRQNEYTFLRRRLTIVQKESRDSTQGRDDGEARVKRGRKD